MANAMISPFHDRCSKNFLERNAATWVPDTPAHSWQAVDAGGMSIDPKLVIVAAKDDGVKPALDYREPLEQSSRFSAFNSGLPAATNSSSTASTRAIARLEESFFPRDGDLFRARVRRVRHPADQVLPFECAKHFRCHDGIGARMRGDGRLRDDVARAILVPGFQPRRAREQYELGVREKDVPERGADEPLPHDGDLPERRGRTRARLRMPRPD